MRKVGRRLDLPQDRPGDGEALLGAADAVRHLDGGVQTRVLRLVIERTRIQLCCGRVHAMLPSKVISGLEMRGALYVPLHLGDMGRYGEIRDALSPQCSCQVRHARRVRQPAADQRAER